VKSRKGEGNQRWRAAKTANGERNENRSEGKKRGEEKRREGPLASSIRMDRRKRCTGGTQEKRKMSVMRRRHKPGRKSASSGPKRTGELEKERQVPFRDGSKLVFLL